MFFTDIHVSGLAGLSKFFLLIYMFLVSRA